MTAPWYVSFAERIDRGEPVYRRCEACGESGWPPRHTCSACGEPAMEDVPLSAEAEIVSFTEIHVTIPQFVDQTPYTVVLAAFDEGVTLTGQLRGDGPVSRGDPVTLGVEQPAEESWLITFTPP